MTKNNLKNEYFNWIYDFVFDKRYSQKLSYNRLLQKLYSMDFTYGIPMDGNRAEDGVDLRYRFGEEKEYDDAVIAAYLDDFPCSVLEMMVALAIRCEEHIMDDPEIGNRTGQWFWNMIVNLGLGIMNDSNFDEEFVDEVINKFLNRKYEKNGRGGLFTVKNHRRDLRQAEIWYQMCWYLDENA